eukprot:scaffold3886_cov399-Prasinococcus_capsulatus_cf.AAC.30
MHQCSHTGHTKGSKPNTRNMKQVFIALWRHLDRSLAGGYQFERNYLLVNLPYVDHSAREQRYERSADTPIHSAYRGYVRPRPVSSNLHEAPDLLLRNGRIVLKRQPMRPQGFHNLADLRPRLDPYLLLSLVNVDHVVQGR